MYGFLQKVRADIMPQTDFAHALSIARRKLSRAKEELERTCRLQEKDDIQWRELHIIQIFSG